MKLNEIIAHNKANLERCTEKQANCMRNNMPGLDEDSDTKNKFISHCRFDRYVRKAGHYELVKGRVPKYVCTCLCWSKDYDSCRCFIQFGFNNRNRLRNRLQHIQKNNDDIVCRVISINSEETNGK